MMEVTREEIVAGLRRVGLREHDLVMVHSSLSSFGHVMGGADTVIDVILEVIGQEGTAVFPTFTFSFVGDKRPAFHVSKTPSVVGRISEVFRCRSGTLRSRHPTHSVACCGPLAEWLIENHERLTPLNRQGPFGKMYDRAGRILLLGVSQEVVTTYHAVEEWVQMPYLVPGDARVLNENGEETIVHIDVHPPGHRNFQRMAGRLDASGQISKTQIGLAAVQLFAVADLVEKTVEVMRDEPGILLREHCNCEFCTIAKRSVTENGPAIRERCDFLMCL